MQQSKSVEINSVAIPVARFPAVTVSRASGVPLAVAWMGEQVSTALFM